MFGKNIRDGEKVHEWVVDILKDNKVEYLRVPPGPYICSKAVCFFVYEAGEDALCGSVDASELGTYAFKNKRSLKNVILKILEGGVCDDGGLWASLFELTHKLERMHVQRPRRGSLVQSIAMRRKSCVEPMSRKKSWVESLTMRISFKSLSPTSPSSPIGSPFFRRSRTFLSSDIENGSQESI
jgi:hypothetical protein